MRSVVLYFSALQVFFLEPRCTFMWTDVVYVTPCNIRQFSEVWILFIYYIAVNVILDRSLYIRKKRIVLYLLNDEEVVSFPSNNHFGLLYRELRKTEK